MARFVLKPFANVGGVTGQFGSFEANGGQIGDGVLTDDNDTIQGLPAWIDGWDAATNNALKLPRLEEMNGVQKVFSEFAIQNFEDGITYWQAGMSVTANQSVVQYDGKLYLNITGTNTATAPDSDTTNWSYILDLTKEYVDLTSTQYISGTKTFTTPPLTATGGEVVTAAWFKQMTDLPSNSYVALTLGADGATYTAPADGYFTLAKRNASTTRAGYVAMINTTAGGLCIENRQIAHSGTGIQPVGRVFMPAKKNDIVRVQYDVTGATDYFRFIYSQNGSH